jgi:hypothetical protein
LTASGGYTSTQEVTGSYEFDNVPFSATDGINLTLTIDNPQFSANPVKREAFEGFNQQINFFLSRTDEEDGEQGGL